MEARFKYGSFSVSTKVKSKYILLLIVYDIAAVQEAVV